MNEPIERIICRIESNFKSVPMDLTYDSWKQSIPAEPGWYLIETNTPIEELKSVGPPQYPAHINIPKAIDNVSALISVGAAIKQSGNNHYVVYNGEAQNLKSRAREHVRGHRKTFCLGLANYPALREYGWRFCYVPVSSCEDVGSDDKSLRLFFEQVWRATYGWPILCKR